MRIIRPLLPDPTDIVIAGDQSALFPYPYGMAPALTDSKMSPVLQGRLATSDMAGFPVPRAMIGQHEWFGINPRTIGPMRFAGGLIDMVLVGALPVDVFVDPIQRWLRSAYAVDKAGFIMPMYDAKTIGAPEAFSQFMLAEPATISEPVVTIPRGAVARSGLAKRITCPNIPSNFGGRAFDNFVEATTMWFVRGVTRDDAGAALGSCRVILLRPDKMVLNPDILANPIVADIMSDGSGIFSVQVNSSVPVLEIAYKAGAPDVAGVSRIDALPV